METHSHRSGLRNGAIEANAGFVSGRTESMETEAERAAAKIVIEEIKKQENETN